MAGGDTQLLLRALDAIRSDLRWIIFQNGYAKAQREQILRQTSTPTATDTPTATLFGKMKELYETGEFLTAIGRFLLRHLLKIPAIAVGVRECLRWLGLG